MEKHFLISTTAHIEGSTVQEYIDVVCANVVVGTNVFSDIAASFTDFFGGRSDSYKKKLSSIYDEAVKELQQKASRIGANAIIGFKVDFDEISGKDKSMFMVSVSGTACKVDYIPSARKDNTDIVSDEALKKEIYRKIIISKVREQSPLKDEWVAFMLENPMTELLPDLAKQYVKYQLASNESLCNIIQSLISAMPKDEIIDEIYCLYTDSPQHILPLMKHCRLFDASLILGLLNSSLHLAIPLLSLSAEYYTADDLKIMEQICNKLDTIPDTGSIETVKSGILGKEQMKFICENGHKNDPQEHFCNTCHINIKGLSSYDVDLIEQFKEKVTVLSKLMKRNQ